MSNRVTEEKIKEVFKQIVKANEMPTAAKIEEVLNIPYKSGTVYKYLQALKIQAYQKWVKGETGAQDLSLEEHSQIEKLLHEKQEWLTTLEAKSHQNKVLSTELINVEKEKRVLQERLDKTEKEFQDLQKQFEKIQYQAERLEVHCHEIKEEREVLIEAVLKDKNHQIYQLQQELKETNEANLTYVKKMGFETDDAIIQEKVKTITLEDKVKTLSEDLKNKELELKKLREQQVPLIQQIAKLKEFIQKSISWEQMAEYERLMNNA